MLSGIRPEDVRRVLATVLANGLSTNSVEPQPPAQFPFVVIKDNGNTRKTITIDWE
jgi:hypothetical protein